MKNMGITVITTYFVDMLFGIYMILKNCLCVDVSLNK